MVNFYIPRAPHSAYSLYKHNGLVCIGRPSHTVDAKKIFKESDQKKYNIYIIEEETVDISSTKVRDAIMKGI